MFGYTLLYTTVVICGYLRYGHLPVSFDQSGPSPLTSLINKAFLPAELLLTRCFWFFAPFYANSIETVERENPRTSAISEIHKPSCLMSAINNEELITVCLRTLRASVRQGWPLPITFRLISTLNSTLMAHKVLGSHPSRYRDSTHAQRKNQNALPCRQCTLTAVFPASLIKGNCLL